MAVTTTIIQLETLAALRLHPVAPWVIAFCLGSTTAYDGMGGLYRWDASATGSEDSPNFNTVISSLTGIGRWVRVFQRTRDLPHGKLTYIGSTKIFTANGVTDANGRCTLRLTMDNTDNGPAIFTEIAYNDSQFSGAAASPVDAVLSYVYTQPTAGNNLKTTTHGFYKANLLSIVLNGPFAAVGAGQPIRFRVEGR